MRSALTVVLAFFSFLTAIGQKGNSMTIFKHSYFLSGTFSNSKEIKIKVDTILELDFYQKNFYLPRHSPEKFINNSYRNQKVEVWSDSTKAKDYFSNWLFTYVYDSLSRVTHYNYSGCIVCSQQAFQIQITYNQQNKPLAFQIRHSLLNSKEKLSEEYLFTYDKKGNITKIKFYNFGKLSEQIEEL